VAWPGTPREYRDLHGIDSREWGRLGTKEGLHSRVCTIGNRLDAHMDRTYERHGLAVEVRFDLVLYIPIQR